MKLYRLTEFNRSIHSQQDIIRFDISVDNVSIMKEFQCLQYLNNQLSINYRTFQLPYLSAYSSDHSLLHLTFSDDVSQWTSRKEFHDHPQFLPNEIRIEIIHDIGMFILPHNENFVDDQLFLRLVLQIHLKHRRITSLFIWKLIYDYTWVPI